MAQLHETRQRHQSGQSRAIKHSRNIKILASYPILVYKYIYTMLSYPICGTAPQRLGCRPIQCSTSRANPHPDGNAHIESIARSCDRRHKVIGIFREGCCGPIVHRMPCAGLDVFGPWAGQPCAAPYDQPKSHENAVTGLPMDATLYRKTFRLGV